MSIRHSSRLLWQLTICAIATLIFLIRLHGATDLESYGQPTRIGYLLDLITQGHFFVMHDLNNVVMSAPPLHTWAMAPFAAVFGLDRAALALPSFLAVFTNCVLLFEIGRRRLGELPAGLAAIAFLLAPGTAKHIALVSPGPVFACLVATAILVCSTAWPKPEGERRRWFLFSFVSALAVLTMGTPGLFLPIAGLLTSVWNGWRIPQVRAASTLYFSAFALFVGVVLAWLVPAGLDYGFAPILRLFALQATRWETAALLTPSAHLLQHYLPFSLFLFPALWRVIRHPAADGGERSFERLLAAWLAVGLLIVSLIEQNAGDAVFALWPAGALLVGRELARLAERMGKTKFAGVAVVISCFLIGAIYNAAHSIGAASLATSPLARELQLARNAELAAGALKASGIDIHNLNHLNTPRTVQLYLGTFQPLIVRTELQALLASTDGPVDLALGAANIEELDIPARLAGTRQTFRWPEDPSQPPVLQVYRITR